MPWPGFDDIIGRAEKVIGGLYEATEAVPGAVWDLVTLPIDEPNSQLVTDIYRRMADRSAQVAQGLLGPQSGVGALIGGAPSQLRTPVRIVTDPLIASTTYARHELVSQPIATAITAASISSRKGNWGEQFFKFFDPSIWPEAYHIGEHRSPGQAAALALLTKDILNEQEVRKAQHSDMYQTISGTFDLFMALKLDPTVVLGKGFTAFHAGTLGTIAEDTLAGKAVAKLGGSRLSETDRYVINQRLHEFAANRPNRSLLTQDQIAAIQPHVHDQAEYIYHNFHDNPAGLRNLPGFRENDPTHVILARTVASASSPQDVERIINVGMGFAPARIETERLLREAGRLGRQAETEAKLRGINPVELEQRLNPRTGIGEVNTTAQRTADRLDLVDQMKAELGTTPEALDATAVMHDVTDANTLLHRQLGNFGWDEANNQEAIDAALARIEMYGDKEAFEKSVLDNYAVMQRTLPNLDGPITRLKSRVYHEQWYQQGRFGKVLRAATEMEPYNIIKLEKPEHDVQVLRYAQKAGLNPAEQESWRNLYINAANPMERENVLNLLEERAVVHLAEQRGLPTSTLKEIVKAGQRYRTITLNQIRARVYSVGDGNELVFHPVLTSQLKEHYNYFINDLDAVKKAVNAYERSIGTRGTLERMKRHFTGDEINTAVRPEEIDKIVGKLDAPKHVVDAFYRVWKPATLLRVGWPIRVVGDEQLRIMAKLGALAPMRHAVQGVKNLIDRDPAEFYHGQRIPGPYEEAANYKSLLDARESFSRMVHDEEYRQLNDLRSTGEWRRIAAYDPGHEEAWLRIVNRQYGTDPLAQVFIKGGTVDDGVRWLESHPEYTSRLPWNKDYSEWANQVRSYTRSLVGDNEELLGKWAENGELSYSDLTRTIKDVNMRPAVHGEIYNQGIRQGPVVDRINHFTGWAFKWLGEKPTNTLSRSPYFATEYSNEMKRMIGLLKPGTQLDDALMRKLANTARAHALSQTRSLLYDLAEESRMGHALQYIMPFYPAWQEVLTRWAGLAVEKPAFVRQMQLVYTAPEAAGLVRDGKGNKIGVDGRITEPMVGGPWRKGDKPADGNRFVTIPPGISDVLKHLPGAKKVIRGDITFEKSSVNLLLNGPPGTGPMVQVPINEIVKRNPTLEDTFKFVLPYGVSPSSISLLIPTTVRRLQKVYDDNSDTRKRTVIRMTLDKTIDFNLGKRPDLNGLSEKDRVQKLVDEANHDAHALDAIKFAAGFFSPAGLIYKSPYQKYIDSFRARLQWDAEQVKKNPNIVNDPGYLTPDEWFIQTWGKEFFPATQALSKSVNAVPPTLEGSDAAKKYADLLRDYGKDIGGLILGNEGAGEFRSSVYAAQYASGERTSPPPEEAGVSPDVSLAWRDFRNMMDMIDVELHKRGLPNLQVTGASDLAELKKQTVQQLAQRSTAWAEQYYSSDETSWDRRIAGMKALTQAPQAHDRPEIASLSEYLQLRDQLILELTKRGQMGMGSTLDSANNQDLAYAWDSIVQGLVKNPAFSAVYYRYLSHDPLTRSVAPGAQF